MWSNDKNDEVRNKHDKKVYIDKYSNNNVHL